MLSTFADFLRSVPAWGFWLGVLAIGSAAIASVYYGFRSLYRSRLIADMPTSRLRSAAQGYIELEGRARKMPGEAVYAPLSGKPCVWYSYSVERKGSAFGQSEDWCMLESGVSEAIFHLADDTGVCIVDPDGADVTPSVRLCWRGDSPRPLHTPKKTGFWSRLFSFGTYRYSECRLHDHDTLYAIGQFTGLGAWEAASIKEATRDLLSTWKRDRSGLLQRFDADRNGKIDIDEWGKARQAAEREVISTWRERQQYPETNLLKKPAHGRPFILSYLTQDQLIPRYRSKAMFGIFGFLCLGLFLVWAINNRFA